jgi:hypothetical protein
MKLLPIILLVALLPWPAAANDVAREMKDLVGFTIIKANYVVDSSEDDMSFRLIKLSDGSQWRVSLLILPPLFGTNVLVLSKKFAPEIIARMPAKTPMLRTYEMKLLIRDQVYSAYLMD